MNRIGIFGMLILVATLATTFVYASTSGPSPIPTPPNFKLGTNVITLCKGMYNTVPIIISTPSGASMMQDVQLSLTSSRYALGNGTVNAENITANSVKIVPIRIFVNLNATPLISTAIGINYQYLIFYTDSEFRNISFGTETCATPLSVSVQPYILTTGRIQNVTLNFTNTGNSTLSYLSIHSSLPGIDGTFLGLQPVQIGSIAPKGSASVKEQVFVYNNATQSFPVNLSISFYNGSSLEQLAINPVALASGIINITPSSTTLSPSSPTAGSIFSISLVLTNVGTSKASAVTATALAPTGFSPYGSASTFVGDIQTDTQTPVTLTLITQSSVKPGNYTIPVRISYLNNLRQNLSTTIDIPVEITATMASNSISRAKTARSLGGSGIIGLILIIVIIAVFVLYLMERGKHKKLQEEHRKLKSLRLK